MTLSSSYEYTEFVADGLGTPRTVGFELRQASDLQVTADGVTQVQGTHYAVTGIYPNQQIVPIAPYWADGTTIAYWRQTERKQEYKIPAGQDLRSATLEGEIDRLGMQQQEQDETIDRAPKVPRGEAIGSLPSLAQRKGSLLGATAAIAYAAYDEDGNPTVDTPDNFAAPARAAADDAALSSATAEAAAGRTFDSIAEGLAATAEGGTFAVDNGDGTVTIYRKLAGAADFQRSLATTDALASFNGTEFVGYRLHPSATKRTLTDKLSDSWISAMDFRVLGGNDPGDTARLQAAIDYVLNSEINTLYIPGKKGEIDFSTLNLLDAGGTPRAQRGKIHIVGDGKMGISDLQGGTDHRYGTVLNCTSLDGTHGIVMANGSTTGRHVTIEGVSVIYGGTGRALHCDYCPEAGLRDVGIRITSTTGEALFVQDAWYFVAERVFACVDNSIVSTAVGMTFDATLFAGNVYLRDCVFNGFNDCVHLAPSSNFANFVMENCAPQKFKRYGVFGEGPLWNIVFRDHYTETGGGTNCIKIAPSAGKVANFRVDGGFILGGTNVAAWLTGAAIDIATVQQCELRGIKYRRPWTALINQGANVGSIAIDGVDVSHDGAANLPGVLYLVTGAEPVGGNVSISNRTLTSHANLAWFNPATQRVAKYDGKGAVLNSLAFGPLQIVSTNGSAFDWNGSSDRGAVLLAENQSGIAQAIKLPALAGLEHGDVRKVVNNPASGGSWILQTHDSIAIGVTLAPGDAVELHADKINSKFLGLRFVAGAVSYGG